MSRKSSPRRSRRNASDDAAAGRPSKTRLKARSVELKALGTRLLELQPGARAALALPQSLLDALDTLETTRSFEGRRRQAQYVGRLMRRLEEEQLQAIESALEAQDRPAAAETLLLHATENWRERLLASDDALQEWMEQVPGSDSQQLRALVRQARSDAVPSPKPDGGTRHGRAYRKLFRWLRTALQERDAQASDHPITESPLDP